MSMMTQSASSPASSRAHRCRVTASLNVLLSRSSRVTAVTMSSRLVIAVMAGSVVVLDHGRGGGVGRRRPPSAAGDGGIGPGRGDGDHEQRRVAWQLDGGRRQRGVERPGRGQHPAVGLPVRAGPGDRRQLRLQRGPERQVDEGRERLAGGVTGREPEQRGRPVVRPPDRAVLLEQEQRGRGALEGGVQQPPLGRSRQAVGRRVAPAQPGRPSAPPRARRWRRRAR